MFLQLPSFSGAHADIGGGSHKNSVNDSLSFIPLRWMIKECLLAGTGILFDQRALSIFGFDFKELKETLRQEFTARGLSFHGFGFESHPESFNLSTKPPPTSTTAPTEHVSTSESSVTSRWFSVPSHLMPNLHQIFYDHSLLNLAIQHTRDARDCAAHIWDQLDIQKAWWILEILPMLTTYQTADGTWIRQRRCVYSFQFAVWGRF